MQNGILMKTIYRLLVNGTIQTDYKERNPLEPQTFTDRIIRDFEKEEDASDFYSNLFYTGYDLYGKQIIKIQKEV